MRRLKFHFAATKVRPKINASRSATGPRYNVCSGPVRPRGPVQRVVQASVRSSLGRNRPFEIEPEGFEIQSSTFLGGSPRRKPHFEIEPEGFEIQSSSFLGGSPKRKLHFRIFGSELFKILNAKRCGHFETAVSLDTSSKKTISNDFETFGFDFEIALPLRTSSKLEFKTFLPRFRYGAPAQDFLPDEVATPVAPTKPSLSAIVLEAQNGSKPS